MDEVQWVTAVETITKAGKQSMMFISPYDFYAELCLQITQQVCLRSAGTTCVRLHRLRSQNTDLIHQFWALMKVQEQWPDLLAKALLELDLKLSFKQHLSNPSVQEYFLLLWELYVFPSSKRYKI